MILSSAQAPAHSSRSTQLHSMHRRIFMNNLLARFTVLALSVIPHRPRAVFSVYAPSVMKTGDTQHLAGYRPLFSFLSQRRFKAILFYFFRRRKAGTPRASFSMAEGCGGCAGGTAGALPMGLPWFIPC